MTDDMDYSGGASQDTDYSGGGAEHELDPAERDEIAKLEHDELERIEHEDADAQVAMRADEDEMRKG
jgi:hypothetical protein